MRVVADTNIFVSASFWKGNPHKITLLATEGKIELYACEGIMEEFARALRRDFKLPEQEIQQRTATFLQITKIVQPKTTVTEITDDPTDNKILETALEANAQFIVSGDRHLLKLREFKGIRILKAKEFLDIIT